MSERLSISVEAPKLRSELVISRQGSNGAITFVVKDPATGRFFRFREIEGFILEQLDGSTGLDVLRSRVEEKFGASLPPSTLGKFVNKLLTLGLLGQSGNGQASAADKRGRIRGDPLYLRYKAFDPDREDSQHERPPAPPAPLGAPVPVT